MVKRRRLRLQTDGLQSTKNRIGVRACQNRERAAGGQFNDRGDGEVAEELPGKAVARVRFRSLENAAGDPAVALIEAGVRALAVRKRLSCGSSKVCKSVESSIAWDQV